MLNDIDYSVFKLHPELGWTVNGSDFHYVDEYGDALPDRANGTLWIPESAHAEYSALMLVQVTGLDYLTICEMRYDEYMRLNAIARAKAWTPKLRDKPLNRY